MLGAIPIITVYEGIAIYAIILLMITTDSVVDTVPVVVQLEGGQVCRGLSPRKYIYTVLEKIRYYNKGFYFHNLCWAFTNGNIQ